MTRSELIDLLLDNDQGRIIICNILNGLDEELFDDEFVRTLFDWWSDLCVATSSTSITSVLAALNALIFKSSPPRFREGITKPDFQIFCRKKSRFVNGTEMTTVVSAFVFGLIIHPTDKNQLVVNGFEFPTSKDQVVNDSALSKLIALPESARRIRLNPSVSIGENLVWYTPRLELEKKLVSATNHANKTRDLLGLAHKKSGDVMIALHFDAAALKFVKNGRPIFADAGNEPRFKAVADNISARKNKAWGRTADLELFSSGKLKLDGLPERVCSPINHEALRACPEILFTPLGRVTSNSGETAYDSNSLFAQHLMSHYKTRTKAKMRREMIAII